MMMVMMLTGDGLFNAQTVKQLEQRTVAMVLMMMVTVWQTVTIQIVERSELSDVFYETDCANGLDDDMDGDIDVQMRIVQVKPSQVLNLFVSLHFVMTIKTMTVTVI